MIIKVSRKEIADAMLLYFTTTKRLKPGQELFFKDINPNSVDAFFEMEILKMKKWEHVNDDGAVEESE